MEIGKTESFRLLVAGIRNWVRPALAACLACLAACASTPPDAPGIADPEPSGPAIRIYGSLAFRDGVLPPRGSTARITLRDFGDEAAAPLAGSSIVLERARVMLPFEFSVPVAELDPARQYVVSAIVSGPADEALWTTDVAQLIDSARLESNVGVLLMTQSRSAGTRNGEAD